MIRKKRRRKPKRIIKLLINILDWLNQKCYFFFKETFIYRRYITAWHKKKFDFLSSLKLIFICLFCI